MYVLPLETGITYGPLYSRRLGLSLGVNILPVKHKLCSFDCVYCHYGATQVKTMAPVGETFSDISQILKAIEVALRKNPRIDAITFSGNGEPTLHPHFGSVVEAVSQIRDRLCPAVKLALFSNSTTVQYSQIQNALAFFDAPIMKLDAGDILTWNRINCPAAGLDLDRIIDNLAEIPGVVIQSVLIDGVVSNIKEAAFDAWVDALVRIQPRQVQIYSTDYPVPDSGVERVLPYVLERLAEAVHRRTGLEVKPYWPEF
ncbi:MAG: radical SAM protein [Anaerolineae bacterium]|nr:radical SAM protein [Anaerolineae bacterium]